MSTLWISPPQKAELIDSMRDINLFNTRTLGRQTFGFRQDQLL